jgi:hypothetical protein
VAEAHSTLVSRLARESAVPGKNLSGFSTPVRTGGYLARKRQKIVPRRGPPQPKLRLEGLEFRHIFGVDGPEPENERLHSLYLLAIVTMTELKD